MSVAWALRTPIPPSSANNPCSGEIQDTAETRFGLRIIVLP